MKNRSEIEKSIITEIPDIIDLRNLGSLFREEWNYVIIKVDYLFGEDKNNDGIDLIKKVDGSQKGSNLHFFLTIFSGIEGIDDAWVEN